MIFASDNTTWSDLDSAAGNEDQTGSNRNPKLEIKARNRNWKSKVECETRNQSRKWNPIDTEYRIMTRRRHVVA